MVIYPDYERYKTKYHIIQDRFAEVLMEKERLLTKTLPSAITYDKDKVQCSPDSNPLENYVISLEEKKINEKLNQLRDSLRDWEILLSIKERELRSSSAIQDKIYVYRYIEGHGIGKISSIINYSKRQTYRVLGKIDKTVTKMAQNVTNDVLK
jgi:hypothetical protein